jgi:sugar-specific transcriptional regulator TrmB
MFSSAEIRFITEQLESHRCTRREVEIYIESLKSGPSSVQSLARKISNNRVTVHSAVEQLISKGLMFESLKGKRRLVAAEDPEVLFHLLQIKENELENSKANLGYVVGLLQRIQKPTESAPNVRFYEGIDGFKKTLEMSLSARGEFISVIDIEFFSRHLSPEYLKNYFSRRSKLGIKSRLLWPHHSNFARKIMEDVSKYNIKVRVLPSNEDWRSGFLSWNNVVSLLSFSSGNITCTIIENEDIAFFYRNIIFQKLWVSELTIPYYS